jgi:23S rRNA (uracil1939-C5)-methyltransferase
MDVRIEKLVYGGDGLAHLDGQTVFVPLVLPGEVVTIAAASKKKKLLRGRLLQVTQSSPERVPAPCPYFARCGGCNYQHIAYDAQLRYKSEILRETLSRIGRIRYDGALATHASPPYAYRNRTQWKIARVPEGEHQVSRIGYFEPSSTRLCAIDECTVLSPRLQQTLGHLRALLSSDSALQAVDEIEAFSDAADEKVLLNLSADKAIDSGDALAARLRAAMPYIESILIHNRKTSKFSLLGPGYMNYTVGDTPYRVGHLSFFQVNRFLLDALVGGVIGDNRGRLALDLYAGVGLFTLPLATRFKRVIGVEANPAAAKDLEVNLHTSGGASVSYRESAAENFLAHWNETPDLVVLDPPRAGVAPELLARLKKLLPWRIHYLSCDPATLARDLSSLVGTPEQPGPYEIIELNLFDIFPQTYHMEVLAKLKRRK